MATGELLRPGVEVIQQIRKASPTVLRPTLVPCVVGTAFEVVNVLNSDGTINTKAKWGSYAQIAKAISESAFPDPRGNIAELDFLEDTVRPYLLHGGSLSYLPLTHGSAFLASLHKASKAAIQTDIFSGVSGKALNGLVLTLAIDLPAIADHSRDIAITFVGSGAGGTGVLTSQQCADQINTAVGEIVATVVGASPNDRVQIASPTYGALSSVTIRPGTANVPLKVAFLTTDGNYTERVEGAGLRGQDDLNNDTITPWVEFFQGEYYYGAASAAVAASYRAQVGAIDLETQVFAAAKAAAVTFSGGSPTVPLKVGDFVIADGVRLASGEVMKVETSRFKVGTINTLLSSADAQGNYTTKVYDTQQVGTAYDSTPFAPTYCYFVANDINWRLATGAMAATVTGTTVSFAAATAATVATVATPAGPYSLQGLGLHYTVTIDGVETEGTFTFTAASYADMDAVVAALGTNIPGVLATNAGGQLTLTSTKTGILQGITVWGNSTCRSVLLFASDVADVGSDTNYTGLTGKYLTFQFDSNPHTYQVLATSLSLEELVAEVNKTVGATVATISSGFITLTSPLKGIASRVTVLDTGSSKAEDILGLTAGNTNGTGRPYPDAYLDDSLVLHIGSEVLRDSVKGYPLDQAYDTGTLYVQYKALRKDVSAASAQPGVIRVSDTDTLLAVLDPVTEENPLALGMFLTMLNAPTFEVKGLGIDEVTAAAPEGTEVAWARAAALLETEEVYAIAPLTQNEVVQGMWMTHCSIMSAPEQGGERIVFPNKKMPTTKNPGIAASGSAANSTASPNQLVLDTNPSSGLVALGVNPALAFALSKGVYVEVTVASELRRYNVSSVSGSLVNLRTTFATGENTDAFYSDVFLNVPVVNSAYSLKVRGASLTIPGTNPALYDYSLMSETVAEANALYKNRRVYEVFPETVRLQVSGVEKALPGYYASCAIVGMVAAQPPQQGFTNFPIVGLTGVVGSEKFTKRQLNVMAGGGTYILVQEVPGGSVFCRHQLSTDLTSVETRELSITKVVDFAAKILRIGVRRFIGTSNINPQLLDMLGATVHAILKFLEDTGVINGSNINNLVQDKANPDTILVDVTLDVPYPCNYIRLTLMV
jgi:hypothetical protein